MPVGISSCVISSSEMPSRYLSIPRIELPWAATSTCRNAGGAGRERCALLAARRGSGLGRNAPPPSRRRLPLERFRPPALFRCGGLERFRLETRGAYGLAALEGGRDRVLPVGQAAVDRVLQALREGDVLLGDVGVLVVVARPVLGGGVDRRRRDRVRAPPLRDLLVAVPARARDHAPTHGVLPPRAGSSGGGGTVGQTRPGRSSLGDGLLLVESGEPAIHALVEAPVVVHGYVLLPRDAQHDVEGLLRAR